MSRVWPWLLLGIAVTAVAQQPALPTPEDGKVMLAAISRYESMFAGGIGSSKRTGPGTVAVEPLAYITPSGDWSSLPCTSGTGKGCRKFEREYLSKPHVYTAISADGNGATIHAAPTTLSECYGYQGAGTYSGASIRRSAIAASAADFFADSTSPRLLKGEERAALRKALAALIPKRLDSTERLGIFAVRLEGQDFYVVQRTFIDVTTPEQGARLVFFIGTMSQGRFHTLFRNREDDQDERVLEAIRLKSGRDFLVTAVSDPESQFFRVYGIRDGHLVLIYSGGGSSC